MQQDKEYDPTDLRAAEERQPLLRCQGLTKIYRVDRALDDVTLDIPAGKVIGLLGPNGSGKTTFLKLAAGLLTPTAGTLTVLGHPIGPQSKALVAYLPERNSLPDYFTVAEAVSFYADFFPDFDRERAGEMLHTLHVPLSYRIKTLSKGTKEKVQLVMVMARRARLYLLDEPISGVDPAARDFIIETVIRNFSEDSTVLISTHLISDIERVMDGFLFLKNGRIACTGTPAGLMASTGKTVDEYFREVFRC